MKFRPRFISLATKNAAVYFLLTLIGISTLGYLLFRNSAEEIIQSSEQQVKHATETVEIKFASFIQSVQNDIIHLTQSPFLENYLTDFEASKKELLSAEYLTILRSKPDYAQIRLIGMENFGQEIIRAERAGKSTFLVEMDGLQQKGHRNYFINASRLPKDSIYFSVIDLNKEFGEISLPVIPTFRVASPVYRNGDVFGIVIINVNLIRLFQELKTLTGPNFDIKLSDHEGHFLIHPDSTRTFTFEYGKEPMFKDDFGQDLSETVNPAEFQETALFKENGLLYVFSSLPYPRYGYSLYLGVGSNEEAILASFYLWRRKSMVMTLGLVAVVLFISLSYMRRQVNELKDITKTMVSFPRKLTPAQLPITRNDEIGQLARRFEEMSKAISRNLSKLQSAKEKVEEAVHEKDAFLENMSHEIRNPIHSMIGMIHLLEKNDPGLHQKAFIESLKFNSENLLSLVNDILDYRKLSIGELNMKPEWFDLSECLNKISKSHQLSASAKNIQLEVDIPPALNDVLVFSDPVRLTQIVNNLVINAIKFTPENGAVWLLPKVFEKTEKKYKVRFSVRDTGIGIEKSKVRKIFERFYTQEGLEHGIMPEGSGLGLPIIIQILKLLDSKLNIDSQPGEGTHFYFDLELPIKGKKAAANGNTPGPPSTILQDAQVLVIDDDEQIVLLYEHLLEGLVRSITKISDIQEIRSLSNVQFDIVLSDLHFGEKSLFDYEEDLRKPLGKNGILFVISGIDTDKKPVMELPNIIARYQKPLNPKLLLESLIVVFASRKFGVPNTQNFWEDYDHIELKYRRAIDLLVKDWKKMTIDLEAAINLQDINQYVALRHKLITSVRRLGLNEFERFLGLPFQKDTIVFPEGFASKTSQRMQFFVWWLKTKA